MSNQAPPTDNEDLAFLRQVLRDLTHEIAAPLTPLFGHLDLLELRTEDKLTSMQMRCIHAMRRSLRRLTAINDRMLELARLERGHIPCEPAPQSPHATVAEVLRRFHRDGISRGIELVSSVGDAADARILADWNLLVMALGHLVDNALRHAPEQGQVEVCAQPRDSLFGLAVVDRGPGVTPRELERIVRPFYRVSEQEGYTETAGLGLTIVELIARRLEGRLELELTDPDDSDRPGLTARLLVPLAAT
jgi:signal transduction histidine kinase